MSDPCFLSPGPVSWVHRQMMSGVDPRTVLEHLIPGPVTIPDNIDEMSLWKAVIELLTEPPRREKLPDVNLLEDVINLILKCKNIIVLTGAGVNIVMVFIGAGHVIVAVTGASVNVILVSKCYHRSQF